MKRFRLSPGMALFLVLALAAIVLIVSACTGAKGPEGSRGAQGAQGLQGPPGERASMALADVPDLISAMGAIAATARYLDVNNALADGYISTVRCVASPAGAMGIHYVNMALAMDSAIDPARPAILLYLPATPSPRLVGVEYTLGVGPPGAPVPPSPPPAPSVFGKAFNGPMAGHAPEDPPHYDLHVWLWAENPSGIFEDFNPALTCP